MNSADEVMRILGRLPEKLRALSEEEFDRRMAKWLEPTSKL